MTEQVGDETATPLDEVATLIHRKTGMTLDKAQYRTRLKRTVENRIDYHDVESIDDYLDLVRADGTNDELRALIDGIVVNETLFYRNKGQVLTLEERIFPKYLEQLEDRPVRVLSAGCSTGAEPYSVSIARAEVRRRFEIESPPGLEITGVDVSRSAIKQARKGIYSRRAVENAPDRVQNHYFREHPEGYRVVDEVRDSVTFRVENLFEADFSEPRDLIFIRNILIYFEPDRRRELLDKMDELLTPDGLLFVGHSEDLGSYDDRFESVDFHPQIYRKQTSTESELNTGADTNRGTRSEQSTGGTSNRKQSSSLVIEERTANGSGTQKLEIDTDDTPSVAGARRKLREAVDRSADQFELVFKDGGDFQEKHLHQFKRILETVVDSPEQLSVRTRQSGSREIIHDVLPSRWTNDGVSSAEGAGIDETELTSGRRGDPTFEEHENEPELTVQSGTRSINFVLNGEYTLGENPELSEKLSDRISSNLRDETTVGRVVFDLDNVRMIDRGFVRLLRRVNGMLTDEGISLVLHGGSDSLRRNLRRWGLPDDVTVRKSGEEVNSDGL
jgi:chemotaxis protein methyltransferase CheR